jgi:ankyrin repeat protein
MTSEEDLICPLTRQIYKRPVTAIDGYIYEEDFIKQWFKKSKSSPMTREEIEPYVIQNQLTEKKVNDFLNENPDKIVEQFGYITKTYEQLIIKKPINLSIVNKPNLNKILNEITFKKYLFLIDNIDDIDKQIWDTGHKLIHMICKHSHSNKIIKHIIDLYIEKDFDLNSKTNDEWRPIHYLCRHKDSKIVKYMIDIYMKHNIDIHICTTENGWKPIHMICSRGNHGLIKYIIDTYVEKQLDLNCFTETKQSPIHMVCRNGNRESINYLISKNIDIQNVTSSDDSIVSCMKSNKKLKKFEI